MLKKTRENSASVFEPKSSWLFYILKEIRLWIEKTTQVNDFPHAPVLVKSCWVHPPHMLKFIYELYACATALVYTLLSVHNIV